MAWTALMSVCEIINCTVRIVTRVTMASSLAACKWEWWGVLLLSRSLPLQKEKRLNSLGDASVVLSSCGYQLLAYHSLFLSFCYLHVPTTTHIFVEIFITIIIITITLYINSWRDREWEGHPVHIILYTYLPYEMVAIFFIEYVQLLPQRVLFCCNGIWERDTVLRRGEKLENKCKVKW